jgi:bifunctional oligoribonuclease and PAP phosphatase NrnA
VILTTHVNADGDAAGSEAAVAAWLESRGVRVTILNPTPFPAIYRFLLHRDDVVVDLEDPDLGTLVDSADLALVLDTGEPRRIAPVDERIRGLPTLVLDHHPVGPVRITDDGLVDPDAAAAGELVYDLIRFDGGRLPAESVLATYVAIVSDTGSFRYGNTTPRVHAIAAELLGQGIDPEDVFRRLYATAPLRRLELLREALDHLGHDPERGLAWVAVPRALSERLGATAEDFDNLMEQIRSIAGTQLAILFRETAETETKLSLRSAGAVDVNRLAREFGGGGHVKASGATVAAGLTDAVDRVLERARRAIDEAGQA